MIVFLHGILADKQPNKAVIDVSGVGYEAGISTQTFASLPATGSEIRILTYHHMTESEQRLFGFIDSTEMSLFEMLIKVKGVGPRLALTILSGMPAHDIAGCIARQDAVMLARTPGIGKKTAERLVLELKDKVNAGSNTGTSNTSGTTGFTASPHAEAISALEALGFKTDDAVKAVQKAGSDQKTGTETGDVVRAALQLLYKP